jgi:hypothetical protein
MIYNFQFTVRVLIIRYLINIPVDIIPQYTGLLSNKFYRKPGYRNGEVISGDGMILGV